MDKEIQENKRFRYEFIVQKISFAVAVRVKQVQSISSDHQSCRRIAKSTALPPAKEVSHQYISTTQPLLSLYPILDLPALES